jgi:hypothetical protein
MMGDDLMIMGPGDVVPHEQQGTSIEESRATAESQAGFIMAKQFPRNEDKALNRILNTCRRVTLARAALYAFPKGGTTVSGPSVRLAEAVAQHWGNILFGIREMEQKEGETVMMAYCYDLETNTRAERIFNVSHSIKLRDGTMKHLEDPRDVYEMNFNMGARRKRACILEVIPGDVIELAVEACQATLEASGEDASPENIAKMVKAFEKFKVSKEMIEMRQGKSIDALVATEVAVLRNIFKSIEDGMSTPEKWFGEEALQQPEEEEEEPKPKPKKKAKAKAKKKEAKPKADPPATSKASPSQSEGTPSPSATEAPPGDPDPPNAFEEAAAAKKKESLPLGGEMVDPDDDNTITDRLEVVKFIKEGVNQKSGNPWSLYHVETSNGTKLACFDETVVSDCEDACDAGQLVKLFYRKTPKGLNLLGMEVVG